MVDNSKYQNLWDNILDKMASNYDETQFREVFENCTIVHKVVDGLIYIIVPNILTKTKINKLYSKKITELASMMSEEYLRFKFVTADEVITKTPTKPSASLYETNLNENYSFESFVVGPSNMMSYRMAMSVASQPGIVANPLYIFGGVGLGKTHLMQAIGNYMLDEDVTRKILYVQANTFIEDYSKSKIKNNFDDFERKYNDLDALLVDDIQMLATGKKSQQEFFNLFDKLYRNKKQIIITSDCPASQLKDIMDRLTSRFGWGLTVNIKAPDLEHRVNILKRKVQESSDKAVPDDVLDYIASNFTDNIRELEGGFNRVLFYSICFNADVTLSLAKEALTELLQNKKQNGSSSSYENLISVVADFYNITVADILSKKRKNTIVVPRQICMYILKEKYKLPYKKIGSLLGRDHTTIISGYSKIKEEIKTDNGLKMAVESLTKKVD